MLDKDFTKFPFGMANCGTSKQAKKKVTVIYFKRSGNELEAQRRRNKNKYEERRENIKEM